MSAQKYKLRRKGENMIKEAVSMEERCKEVTEMLLDALGLDDVDAQEVNYEAPLFASQDDKGEGLELDSVDALEIVVAIKNKYGLKLKDEDKKALFSVKTIAEYLNANINEVE